MAKEEQRVYIKIRSLLNCPVQEIAADLSKVYGKDALAYSTVARWSARFKDGRQAVEDDPRTGRPLTAFCENDVIAVQNLITEDARYTVEEISDISGLSSGAVFNILKDKLKLRKVCARWIPHLLTEHQKQERVRIASELLRVYEKCDDRRIFDLVTGDETWISFFEPAGKENNKVWIGQNGDRPQIARRSRSIKRVLYALFFDASGMVLQYPVPEHTSVTGKLYAEKILPGVVNHYIATRPRTGVRGLKLLHDNAPAHKSAVVIDYLTSKRLSTLEHPPYSPDLAPCDFWLNPLIKQQLRGRRFETRTAVGRALYQCTSTIPKSEYKQAFSDWIKRLNKCVQVHGEYFEGFK